MCGQEGKSSKSLSEPQVQLQQLRQPCRATLWSSHRAQQSWSHGLLPPNNPANILPPSLFLSLPFFSPFLPAYQADSVHLGAEGGPKAMPGRGWTFEARKGWWVWGTWGSSPFLCGSVLSNSWCSTSSQISLTKVSYLSRFHSILVTKVISTSSLHHCVVSLSNVTMSCHSHPLTQWFSVLIITLDIHQESE